MPDEEHNRGGETADLAGDEESKTKRMMKEHANFRQPPNAAHSAYRGREWGNLKLTGGGESTGATLQRRTKEGQPQKK